MKSLLMSMAVLIAVSVLSGCYKDVINPGQDPNGPPQPVSFSGDLVPLFSANCALSGCHDGTTHNPSLVAGQAYNALVSGGYVNVAVPANSMLYGQVKSGSMPPAGALKATDVQKILDWIRNGAPNN